ncbi:MAG TPA: relaxase/mobilization nuclease domain-containing protein [Chitinophagaceae bacterium]|nr:relaxase/mobilization nuclease domain-containing protein [Chitinophagaceae bacterium]
MVAKINLTARLSQALRYNEEKVARGVADCLGGKNFLLDPARMTEAQKREAFGWRNALNTRARTQTVHLSLSFHPAERLSPDTLLKVADAYLQGLGFGAQPYVVYRHRDAGHPHLHIVSTLIRSDGSRIGTHGLGRGPSEKARTEVEYRFGLPGAKGRKPSLPAPAIRPEPLRYGAAPTRESLALVVSYVAAHYTFCSFETFGAVLRCYNAYAERSAPGGAKEHAGGLLYRILDDGGKKVGAPIVARALPGAPTALELEQKFREGAAREKAMAQALLQKLELSLPSASGSLEIGAALPADMNLTVVPSTGGKGTEPSFSVVDHGTGVVISSGALRAAAAFSPRAAAVLKALSALKEGSGNILKQGRTHAGYTQSPDIEKGREQTVTGRAFHLKDPHPNGASGPTPKGLLRRYQRRKGRTL